MACLRKSKEAAVYLLCFSYSREILLSHICIKDQYRPKGLHVLRAEESMSLGNNEYS